MKEEKKKAQQTIMVWSIRLCEKSHSWLAGTENFLAAALHIIDCSSLTHVFRAYLATAYI